MRRLSVIDGIFLRAHRGRGTPIALQGLWRTAGEVDTALLEDIRTALSVGPLGRRVVSPRIPGARPRWQRTLRAHPLDQHPESLPATQILDWAATRGTDLDPEHSPGWRLSAARLDDGGTVVALTCSHVLTDARGLILAIDQAQRSAAGEPAPAVTSEDPQPDSDWSDAARTYWKVVSGTAGALPPLVRTLTRTAVECQTRSPRWWIREDPGGTADRNSSARDALAGEPVPAVTSEDSQSDSDWSDTVRSYWKVVTGTVRALPALIRTAVEDQARSPDRRLGEDPGEAADEESSTLGARQAAAESAGAAGEPAVESSWTARGAAAERGRGGGGGGVGAGERGGSVELSVAGVVLRCPVVEWERVAGVDGGTANGLFIWFVANVLWASGFPGREIRASVPVDVREGTGVGNDLLMTEVALTRADGPGEIRGKAREAYARRMSSPGGLPEEFLFLVPDRVAYLLTRGAGERDVLCSNIGALPERLNSLGPYRSTGVAARAIHPGLTVRRRPRTRLSGYLCSAGGEYSLTLMSLDPERIPDAAALRDVAARVSEERGLPVSFW